MRRIALALLVVVTGCNEIFGVHRTKHVDAPPDSPDAPFDAPWLPFAFDLQLGTTDTSGAPLPAMQLPFVSPPTIQVGKMGDALQTLTYDGSIPGVRVPPDIATGVWRMVYTLPSDPVATEIQWSVSSAHLTFPSFARAGDSPPPSPSGYKITPQGTPPASWTGVGATPAIVTSGAITNSPAGTPGTEIDFQYPTQAGPLIGTLGTPHSANGDWVALLDWTFVSAATHQYAVTGYAISTASDLSAGSLTASSPTWNTTTQTYPVSYNASTAQARFTMISSLGGACCIYNLDYGLLPNAQIAPMSSRRTSAGTNYIVGAEPPAGLELPLLIALYSDHPGGAPPMSITLADPPTNVVAMPRAYYARAAAPRTLTSNKLENSLQEVSSTTSFQFAASLAQGAMFGGVTLTTGAPQSVPDSGGPVVLTWNNEQNHSADDYVVTLYQVLPASLTPVRRYQVFQPSVTVDGSLMQPGNTYVFGIVARSGFPGVAGGSPDYTAVSLPFSEATTFPVEFTVHP